MKRILTFFLIVITLSSYSINVAAQQRGVGVDVRDEQNQVQKIQLYDASYALVIGASNYRDGWNKLLGVEKDVEAVKNILIRHKFQVEELINPSSEELLPTINRFVNKYGFDEDNRLIIYFAGHGYTETAGDGRKFGYIVPVDSPDPEVSSKEFGRKAVAMFEIENVARRIRSKHALFVFDSCFSGTIISRSKTNSSKYINYLTTQPVRQFITAGAENQEVPDESVFRQMFVRGLEGEADANKDGYILGTELAVYLQEKVIYYRGEKQTPQYGKIRDSKLDRGDIVFLNLENENLIRQNKVEQSENLQTARNLAQKALSELKAAEVEKADELASEALFFNPEEDLALAVRGHARYYWISDRKEHGQSAEDDLQEALRINPSNAIYKAWLGNEKRDLEDKKEVLKHLKSPKNSLEFYALGINSLWMDADGYGFNEAINLEPNFTLAYFNRGMLYADGPTNAQKAYLDMTIVISSLPKDNVVKAIAYYIRGSMTKYINQNPSTAISDLTNTIRILKQNNPYLIAAYEERAKTYLKLGDNEKANSDRLKAEKIKEISAPSIPRLVSEDPSQNSKFQSKPHNDKSSKILYDSTISFTSKTTSVPTSSITSEFDNTLIASLKEKGLTVTVSPYFDRQRGKKYQGGIFSINEEEMRLLPFALLFRSMVELKDLSQYEGLFVSKVTGYFEIVDTNNNKQLGIEKFKDVRGFGNTQEQARQNALKMAAEGISESFLNLVKEKAK